MELETHLIIAQQLNYINSDQLNQFEKDIENIAKMLNRLIKTLKDK